MTARPPVKRSFGGAFDDQWRSRRICLRAGGEILSTMAQVGASDTDNVELGVLKARSSVRSIGLKKSMPLTVLPSTFRGRVTRSTLHAAEKSRAPKDWKTPPAGKKIPPTSTGVSSQSSLTPRLPPRIKDSFVVELPNCPHLRPPLRPRLPCPSLARTTLSPRTHRSRLKSPTSQPNATRLQKLVAPLHPHRRVPPSPAHPPTPPSLPPLGLRYGSCSSLRTIEQNALYTAGLGW